MNNGQELMSLYGYIKGIIMKKYSIGYPDYEDVIGEVFVCCVKNMPEFRGDCALKTWVYRITIRRSLDHVRKQVSQRRGMEKLKRIIENSRLIMGES